MTSNLEITRKFYDMAYAAEGFAAQRLYPNEELLRFMGTHFFPVPREERKAIRILEVGCGSCANLWMIAREGFDAYGIDLSAVSLELGHTMLAHWQTHASLTCTSMTDTGYPDAHFDAVVDVFSAYCLAESEFSQFISEASRILKPGGRFFSYTPSKNNDSFLDPAPATFLDRSTLNGIERPTAPFFGQAYPFRFTEPEEIEALLNANGVELTRCERIGRTYRSGQERFEFLSVHAVRQR